MWTCVEGKKKSLVVSFLPLCFLLLPLILFFILTVSHNLALCCISVSLYFSSLANDVSALCSTFFVSLPFSSLLFSLLCLNPSQYFSLYAQAFISSLPNFPFPLASVHLFPTSLSLHFPVHSPERSLCCCFCSIFLSCLLLFLFSPSSFHPHP